MAVNRELLARVQALEERIKNDPNYHSLIEIPDDYPGLKEIHEITGEMKEEQPEQRIDAVKDLLSSGYSYREIAKSLHLREATLRGFIKRNRLGKLNNVYSIYKGDQYLFTGTLVEIANHFEVKLTTARFYVYNKANRQGNKMWGIRVGRRGLDEKRNI